MLLFLCHQVKSWPTQPLDAAIAWLGSKPESMTVADFGCGDARLAATVKQVRVVGRRWLNIYVVNNLLLVGFVDSFDATVKQVRVVRSGHGRSLLQGTKQTAVAWYGATVKLVRVLGCMGIIK
jgi:hypothetical protein